MGYFIFRPTTVKVKEFPEGEHLLPPIPASSIRALALSARGSPTGGLPPSQDGFRGGGLKEPAQSRETATAAIPPFPLCFAMILLERNAALAAAIFILSRLGSR
ncbi:MAG: hypothetical protein A2Z99_07900 [Treponema sp. GWB1_62_6]|nr:MAG: hypothetical protein A2Z99_07900 [Treponema sp. GWB1_62_6]